MNFDERVSDVVFVRARSHCGRSGKDNRNVNRKRMRKDTCIGVQQSPRVNLSHECELRHSRNLLCIFCSSSRSPLLCLARFLQICFPFFFHNPWRLQIFMFETSVQRSIKAFCMWHVCTAKLFLAIALKGESVKSRSYTARSGVSRTLQGMSWTTSSKCSPCSYSEVRISFWLLDGCLCVAGHLFAWKNTTSISEVPFHFNVTPPFHFSRFIFPYLPPTSLNHDNL